MSIMVRGLILLSALLTAWPSEARADWQESYRSYQEALGQGDRAAAEEHAREAWQESREAMPPSENRALLAQNYVALAVLSSPNEAGDALQDAIGLAQAGFGTSNFDAPTLTFMQAEVLSELQPGKRKPMRKAIAALGELTAANRVLNVPFQQQVRLIGRLHEAKLWREVIEVAGSTSEILGGVPDTPPAIAVSVEAFRTNAVLRTQPSRQGEKNRFARDLEQTRQRYLQIGSQIGPQPSIDEFDEVLARVLAYLGLVEAFQQTYDHNPGEGAEDGVMSTAAQRSCDGQLRWTKRPMTFPRSQYGTNAAVLVGYHLSDDGLVLEPRILGEVPMSSPFGERVLAQISKWEADADGLSPVCRRDRTTVIQFTNVR